MTLVLPASLEVLPDVTSVTSHRSITSATDDTDVNTVIDVIRDISFSVNSITNVNSVANQTSTYSTSAATDDASHPHTDDAAVSATVTVPVEASSLVTKHGECFSSQKMMNVIPS